MNWSKGYSAAFYAALVDTDTWRDYERIEITGGNISRSTAELKESADIDCTFYDQSRERWIRIYMDTEQDGGAAHVPLFTGLAVSPDKDINGLLVTNQVACYSVLKPAQDILLQRGWYAGKGRRGADLIEELLAVTPAPIEIEDESPKLPSYIVAGDGESHLSMALKILDAIGWRIRITGDGTIHICKPAEEPVAAFDNLDSDSIEPHVTVKFDWYSCPNVYRVISGDKCVEVKDTDAIEARGREVWAEDKSPAFNGSETKTMYAKRKLTEAQQTAYTVSYDRRFHPDVTVGDLINLNYPAQDIAGSFYVTSQNITLGPAAKTSETVERQIQVEMKEIRGPVYEPAVVGTAIVGRDHIS